MTTLVSRLATSVHSRTSMKNHEILILTIFLCAWTGSGPGFAQSSAEEQQLLNWNGAITNRSTNHRTSTICQFMSGPKAHGWHDFAPFPPAPVDSSCDDGAGSVGFVQPVGHGDRY